MTPFPTPALSEAFGRIFGEPKNGFTPPEPMPPAHRPPGIAVQPEDDPERTARVEWLVDEIRRCLSADITTEPLVFVPGKPTVLKVIAQGLDYDDLADQMAQLLIDVAAGYRMQGHASELLRLVVERFADGVTK